MQRTTILSRLACLLFLLPLSACECETPPAVDTTADVIHASEPTFAEQAESVRSGTSDTIRLDKTLVTDKDFGSLDGLDDRLVRINLSHTELSDAALARLAKCAELEQLRIASSGLTDDGLAVLATMPRLKHLHLIGSPLTSAAVVHLKKLTGLSSLYLDDTEITQDGMRDIIDSLPNTHIHFDGGHHRDDARADIHEK